MYSISCLRNYINALKRCIDKTCAWIRLVHNSSAEKHSLQSNCTRTNIEIYTQFVQYTFSTANLLMLMIVHNSCLAPSFWNRSLRQCSTEPSLLFLTAVVVVPVAWSTHTPMYFHLKPMSVPVNDQLTVFPSPRSN